MVAERISERASKLCQTKLNAVNLFRGINEFALSTLNYYIGLLPYEPKEFDDLDKNVRRILSEHKVTRHASNMDRLYLKRDQFGRGLTCLVEKAEVMLLKMHNYLNKNPKTRALAEHETQRASHLGLIRDYLLNKYNLDTNDINEKAIRTKHEEARMERIREKRMHGLLFIDDDNTYDRVTSSTWLAKGNNSPQQEGMLCKLQDRNLYFGGASVKCRKLPKTPKECTAPFDPLWQYVTISLQETPR